MRDALATDVTLGRRALLPYQQKAAEALTSAIRAKDLEEVRAAYTHLRPYYEQIEVCTIASIAFIIPLCSALRCMHACTRPAVRVRITNNSHSFRMFPAST